MFWQDKKVLLTGGTGLIGGWLIDALLQQNADIVVLIRDLVPKSQTLLYKVTLVHGDLSDSRFLERVLCEYEIQVVFHLAAQTLVPIANKNPLSTFESNIAGTWNLLEACRHVSSLSSIVVASSDKAYGDADTLPYVESMPLKAIYPYDVSKACTDMLAQSYAKTFRMPIGVTRCGNFYGGGDLNWNRVIPGTIRSILRGNPPFLRSDGSLVRDYIYVKDAASAYMTLAKALHYKPYIHGEVFNFSNETQKTALDIVLTLLKVMGSSLEPILGGVNTGEIQAQYLDSSKSKDILGWICQYSLNEGLQETIEWYKTYFLKNLNNF